MLLPGSADLEGVTGASWEAKIILYSDEAETQTYDLTLAYDVNSIELQIDGVMTLKPGNGLTVTSAAQGEIDAAMIPDQTQGARGNTPWRIMLPRLDGIGKDYPMKGLVRWQST